MYINYFKQIVATLLFVLISQFLLAQNQNTITVTSANSNTNASYEACERIVLKKGFVFDSNNDASKKFSAAINTALICDVDYGTGSQLPDITNRTLNTGYEVGSIKGDFNVTPSGAANYSMPITVPPGPGGYVPNLSVNYSSQSRDGLFGWAFQLGGLSEIVRVPQTMYYDNNAKGVALDNTDRFALDGKRLVSKTGQYGDANSEYSTEIANYSQIKVLFHDPITDQPLIFSVIDKAGNKYLYGSTGLYDNQNLLSSSNTKIIKWLLASQEDIYGNTITYTYRQEAGRVCLLDHISYGYNTLNPGQNDYNIVQFEYKKKPDANVPFIGGESIYESYLISKITTSSNNVTAHEYDFNYQRTGLHSLLYEIVEKGSDGKQYNPTQFQWNDDQLIQPVLSIPFNNSIGALSGSPISLDYNADGIDDILLDNKIFPFHYENDVQKVDTPIPLTVPTNGYLYSYISRKPCPDLDGDGKSDLLIVTQLPPFPSYQFNVILSSSPGTNIEFYSPSEGPGVYNADTFTPTITFGDFTGDGISDIFFDYYNLNKYYTYSFNTPNAWQTPLGGDAGGDLSDVYTKVIALDVDGNGKSELLYVKKDESILYNVVPSTGQLVQLSRIANYPNYSDQLYSGDFNGDGNADLLIHSSGGWSINYYSSLNGKKFLQYPVPGIPDHGDPSDASSNYEYFVADFNGDGKSDILEKGPNGSGGTNLIVYYSLGLDQFSSVTENYAGDMSSKGTSCTGDFDGNGQTDFIYKPTGAGDLILFKFNQSDNINKIKAISDGLGKKTEINYKTLYQLSKDNNYSKDANTEAYPVINTQLSIKVVSSINVDNGVGGANTSSYSYSGAKLHLLGKGVLGFNNITVIDNTTNLGISMQSQLNTTIMAMLPYSTTKFYTINGVNNNYSCFTSDSYNILDAHLKYFYVDCSDETFFDYLKNTSTHTHKVIDLNGNLLSKTLEYKFNGVSEGYTTTTNSFGQTTDRGSYLLTSSTEENKRTGQPKYTRTKTYTYYSNGAVNTNADELTSTQYIYNLNSSGTSDYNNIKEIKVTAGGVSRSSLMEYDTHDCFVTKMTNALGHVSLMVYEPLYGNMVESTNANKLKTSYTFDGFGRPLKTTSPTAVTTSIARGWALGTITNSVYTTQTTSPGLPVSKTYYDLLNRDIRTQEGGFNGVMINTDKTYNAKGQLYETYEPYFDGVTSTLKTVSSYDQLGRIMSMTMPTGAVINTTYNDQTDSKITTTNSSVTPIQQSSKTMDAWGTVKTTTDEGGTINYTYASCGKPLQIDVPGSSTTITYDSYGRQLTLTDPDAGKTTYTYTGFGEVLTQVDAKSNTYTMEYDALSRMTKKTGSEGITTYLYDNKANGKGLLGSITGPNGINTQYIYDRYSRKSTVRETIDANAAAYVYSYTYDDQNRVVQTTYPSGLKTEELYNSNGYPYKLNRVGGTSLWECLEMNARKQITSSNGGNGLNQKCTYYDASGLLNTKVVKNTTTKSLLFNQEYDFNELQGVMTGRKNLLTGNNETFTYDALNRLLTSSVNGTQVNTISYISSTTGGSNGNIQKKSDAGVGDYGYDAAHPHAISGFSEPNMNVIPLGEQDITYTAFNKVLQIKEATGTKQLDFTYGPTYERRKTVMQVNGAIRNTTYYLPGYEKSQTNSLLSVTRELSYINTPEGLSCIYAKTGALDTMYYVYTDHLGSYNLITNEQATVKAQLSFDAWGRRRNYNDWSYTLSNTNGEGLFNRGYTGHEHLKDFGIINMGGRCYDPLLGRMLSPDNYVQSQDNTQSYNRYTYCFNNPLKYSDPSGYFGVDAGTYNFNFQSYDYSGYASYNYAYQGFQYSVSTSFQAYWNNFTTTETQGYYNVNYSTVSSGFSYTTNATISGNGVNYSYSETASIDYTVTTPVNYVLNMDYYKAVSDATSQRMNFTSNFEMRRNEINPYTGRPTGYGALETPALDPIDFFAGGLFAGMKTFAAESISLTSEETLFHYTMESTAENISKNGLNLSKDGFVYATTKGDLSAIQAQIELALSPNRGLPKSLFEIDVKGLGEININPIFGPRAVTGGNFGAGGGIEVLFNQPIPPQYLIWKK